MVDWSELPDLGAVALLACAFASVARRNQTPVSGLWLTGWIMIAVHFSASMFYLAPGNWGALAQIVAMASLISAGILFMWASVPYRQEKSSRTMLGALLLTNILYIVLISISPVADWALNPAAAMVGAMPFTVAIINLRKFNHPLRWIVVLLYSGLSIFLMAFQHRPGNGPDLAIDAVLFTVYFGCCTHFCYMYRRATAGAFITIAGFLAWASVFVVAPIVISLGVRVENEVWNLPKFVVAVGMILLLLEDQIEHNKYLALHDDLTGLPNRRLFQDRLASALERARRTEAQTALLVIDLDRFKEVNDTLGHHVGDLLLQRIGTIFSVRVRRSDTVARTGGDEFSVILEEPTSREEAHHVGHSLVQLLNEPLELGEHTVKVGASVGIAVFPEDAPDMETLCIAADLRMYDVKHGASDLSERAGQGARTPRPAIHFRPDAADSLPRAAGLMN